MTGLADRAREWVTREPALPALLDRVARELTGALETDGCLIFRADGDGDLVLVTAYPGAAGPGLRLPRGFGVAGRVAADGIPVVLVDDHPRNPRHRELLGLRAAEPVSRLCVPARLADGGCAAVLTLFTRRRRTFTAAEVATAQEVADLLALRIRLAALTELAAEYRSLRDTAIATTVEIQEAERRRIAGDLHDGVTQVIAGLSFHLSAATAALRDGDLGDAAEQVESAKSLADLAFGEARSAITGLRSPILDDLGLAAGLVSLARSVPNLPIDVQAQDLRLPDHLTTSLFRVAQEAVHNIVKHAEATSAAIRLSSRGRTAVLSIADDGRGFEVTASEPGRDDPTGVPLGLRGMAERVRLIGGQLLIQSRPGAGTTIEVCVPQPAAR